MSGSLLLHALLGLLPVVCFLGALVYLDSYKLVGRRWVLGTIIVGGLIAGLSYLANGWLLPVLDMEFQSYTRYVSPFIEELLKALVIIALIRLHRIGFLVDAAIFGFAVGTGFAVIENMYYLQILPDTGTGVFNHFFLSPIATTLGVLVFLPMLMTIVFQQSEKSVEEWLDIGFDADTELLELINSGGFSESHVGEYLHTLKERFEGPIVADLLCYLRLHVELALRAKGLLMMRESGFEVTADEETRAKLEEMKFLESSIGKTGKLAISPFLQMSRKDLWQFYVLGK